MTCVFVLCLGDTCAIAQGTAQSLPERSELLQVTYQNGLLFISANNAPLAEILGRIQKLTGAAITMPSDVNERVAAQLGPKPAAQVVAELLYGSRYDYVIAGRDTDPPGIDSVHVTIEPPKTVDPPATRTSPPPVESQSLTKANLTGGDEGMDSFDVSTPIPQPQLRPQLDERPEAPEARR